MVSHKIRRGCSKRATSPLCSRTHLQKANTYPETGRPTGRSSYRHFLFSPMFDHMWNSSTRGRGRGSHRSRSGRNVQAARACPRVEFSSGRIEWWKKYGRSIPSPRLTGQNASLGQRLTYEVQGTPIAPPSQPTLRPPPGFRPLPLASFPPSSRLVYIPLKDCNATRPCPCNRHVKNPARSWQKNAHLNSFRRGTLPGHSLLIKLPGEVRNRIWNLCVNDALFCERCRRYHEFTYPISSHMLITGISPFPLLFVNKQIYQELLGLVYSRLAPLKILGYNLKKYPGPDEFRQLKTTPKWPRNDVVQAHARSVKIFLTHGRRLNREWRFNGSWYYMTLNTPQHIAVYDPSWSVFPYLLSYLKTFKSLKSLEFVVEVYQPIVNKITEIKEWDRLSPFFMLESLEVLQVRFATDLDFHVQQLQDEYDSEWGADNTIAQSWISSLKSFLEGDGGLINVNSSWNLQASYSSLTGWKAL